MRAHRISLAGVLAFVAAAGIAQEPASLLRAYLDDESGVWFVCRNSERHLTWYQDGQYLWAHRPWHKWSYFQEWLKLSDEYFEIADETSCDEIYKNFADDEKRSDMALIIAVVRMEILDLDPGQSSRIDLLPEG